MPRKCHPQVHVHLTTRKGVQNGQYVWVHLGGWLVALSSSARRAWRRRLHTLHRHGCC